MGNRPGNPKRLYALALLFCLLLVISLVLLCLTRDQSEPDRRTIAARWDELPVPAEGATKLIVPMEEVSIRDVNERVRYSFLIGDYARTEPVSDPDVNYPNLKSATLLYGRVRFTGGDAGTSWNMHFALDHSEGKPDAYDLLYFDENGDFDLRNDAPRRPLKDLNGLPEAHSADMGWIWFEPVKVSLHFEPDGPRPIELLPRLWLYKDREPQVSLVAARIRRGRFEIDGRSCEAFLSYGSTITGRLDRAFSVLRLICEGGEQPGFVGADQLNIMRSLGGRWCQFSCTPTGDQLFVYPYEGPLGMLQLGAGSRDAKGLELLGEVCKSGARIAIGHTSEDGTPMGTDRYELPVGDYYPAHLGVRIGNVSFGVSNNPYDEDFSGYRGGGERAVPSIRIREDRPFILDFSNKPRVVFVRPQKKDSVSLGSELRVEAVLLDPVLDVTIRSLSDMTRSEKKTFTMASGQQRTFEWPPSLEPRVVIKRADGEIVAEGVMPFG